MEGSDGRFIAESCTRAVEKERPVYRTERGYVLPPGIIPWKEYQKTQTRPMWHADHALKDRMRELAGTREQFVVSDDPEDMLAFELVRAEFRAETNQVARVIRAYLKAADVRAVINGPSEHNLLAWQRNLPRCTVKCFPVLFESDIPKKEGLRMKPSFRVAECLMHFDMDRRLQYLRWHDEVEPVVLMRARAIGFAVDADRGKIHDAYKNKDLSTVGNIVAQHIAEAILRFP